MNWIRKLFGRVTIRFDEYEDAMNALQADKVLNTIWDLREATRMYLKHQPENKDPIDVIEGVNEILYSIIDHRE